jgi:long-chain acyl-CoA synthetase
MWVYPEIRFVGDMISYYAKRSPGRPAFQVHGRRIDFAAFDDLTNRLAHALSSQGGKRQTRVAFLGKNSLDYFGAMFGTVKAGACFVPLNWRLSPHELAVVLADLKPSFAFIEREYEATWSSVCKLADFSPPHVVFDEETTLEAWSSDQPAAPPHLRLREDDPVVQLYTSGTTGAPKGVIHTHASFNHSRLCEHFEKAYDWHDDDVFLFALPNFHLLGVALALQCLYNGLCLVIQRQFDPPATLAAITHYQPTLLVLTPTMIQMLLDHPDAAKTDFSALRLVMYAGSPIALGLIKRAIQVMPCRFMQFYGQTETSGPVSLLRPEEHDLEHEEKLKSCGRPLPLIRLRIVDSEGHDVPDGTPGELLICAPSASAGYYNEHEATDAQFRDGWYYTGDIAYRDAEGLYYIYDRAKDMIVSGGENIYCAEVENVLSLHPAIAAVAVIGVPHPQWGEAVKAVVVLRADREASIAEFLDFCRERLAGYKVPKSIDLIDALPVTGTGKVSKKDLRAPYWSLEERAVG